MNTQCQHNEDIPSFNRVEQYLLYASIDLRKVYAILLSELGFSRPVRYLFRRLVTTQGYPFLTRVLPAFEAHLLRCVEQGAWTYFDFISHKVSPLKTRGSERYTLIFHDELELIFESGDQTEIALQIMRVRQVCSYVYKLALPFSDTKRAASVESFIETDESLQYDESFAEEVRKTAEQLFPQAMRLVSNDVMSRARFGPGSMSYSQFYTDGTMSQAFNKRNRHQDVKDSLDGFYPSFNSKASSTDYPSNVPKAHSGYFRQRKTDIRTGKKFPLIRANLPYGRAVSSELLLVPKDSRAPRTIVRESPINIYVQMGFFDVFHKALERDTKGRVQFTDQGIFHELSQTSSVTKDYCTIDLREASDRVHSRLASTVFANFPAFRFVCNNFRTNNVRLGLGGRQLYINKLAGMGSGLTFPCMAAIIYAAILTEVGLWAKDFVYVYGDDIILPSDLYEQACLALEAVGLRVNCNKSFYRSHFRESCGTDAYYGHDVTPVRLRLAFCNVTASGYRICSPSSKLHWDFRSYPPVAAIKETGNFPTFVLKLERHCRELITAGLHSLANYYYDLLETLLRDILPKGLPLGCGETEYLCRYSVLSTVVHSQHKLDSSGLYPTLSAVKVTQKQCETLSEGLNRSFRNKISSISREALEIPLAGAVSSSGPFGYDVSHSAKLICESISAYSLTG